MRSRGGVFIANSLLIPRVDLAVPECLAGVFQRHLHALGVFNASVRLLA